MRAGVSCICICICICIRVDLALCNFASAGLHPPDDERDDQFLMMRTFKKWKGHSQVIMKHFHSTFLVEFLFDVPRYVESSQST